MVNVFVVCMIINHVEIWLRMEDRKSWMVFRWI